MNGKFSNLRVALGVLVKPTDKNGYVDANQNRTNDAMSTQNGKLGPLLTRTTCCF